MRTRSTLTFAVLCIGALWFSGTGCGSTPTGPGNTPDGGPDAGPDGGALAIAIPGDAPYDTWTWIPFPEAYCANGSTAGIAINPHAGSTHVTFFLAGGGACWDYQNCVAAPTATNLNGVSGTSVVSGAGGVGYFNRSLTGNPFASDNFVFVPYCTGDVHSGGRVTTYDAGIVLHHTGYDNIGAYLNRLVPTFTGTSRIVVSGSSAGGFGAMFNYGRIKAAFPSASGFLIDDSGPPLRPPYFTAAWYAAQTNAWGSLANLPSGCAMCRPVLPDGGANPDGGPWQIIDFYTQDPSFHGSLLETEQDVTISFFGSQSPGNPSDQCPNPPYPCLFQTGLNDLYRNVIKPTEVTGRGEMRAFFLDAGFHPLVANVAPGSADGLRLAAFLNLEMNDDGGWTDVLP